MIFKDENLIKALSNKQNVRDRDYNEIQLKFKWNKLVSNWKIISEIFNLNLENKNIVDLAWIENIFNLVEISLSKNNITNSIVLTPLTKISTLTSLDLEGNKMKEINILSKLTKLNCLILWNNEITNLKPLENLTNLEKLFLNDNQIEDISPLSKLIKLKELSLFNNKIKDITPLKNLTKISELDLANNQIKDISWLSNWNNLLILDLSNNDDLWELSNNYFYSTAYNVTDKWFNIIKDKQNIIKITKV